MDRGARLSLVFAVTAACVATGLYVRARAKEASGGRRRTKRRRRNRRKQRRRGAAPGARTAAPPSETVFVSGLPQAVRLKSLRGVLRDLFAECVARVC